MWKTKLRPARHRFASVRRCSAAGKASSGNVRRSEWQARDDGGLRMAGAIHKMAVYLGLVEDEVAYEDGYDSVEEDYVGYEDEEGAGLDSARQPAGPSRNGYDADSAEPGHPAPVRQTADLTRITTL